jgi:hypothetical protein
MNESDKPADTYSLLAQKQSGSPGSKFISNIIYPQNYNLIWRYPENLIAENSADSGGTNKLKVETSLEKDKFIGAVFSTKTNP